MKKYESLTIRVGPKAYQEIEVNGLDIKKIKTIMGASGGPKWLVLSHLDKLIIDKNSPAIRRSCASYLLLHKFMAICMLCTKRSFESN